MEITERIYNIQTQEFDFIARQATEAELEEEKLVENIKKIRLEEESRIIENRKALLEKLGITEEEAKLLLG